MIDFLREMPGKVWRIRFLFVILDKIGCISTKKIKKCFFIWFCLRFALFLRRLFFKNIMAMEKIILNKLTKDEVLRRLQESKRRKQDRLKELEEGLKADFRNVTGVEAKTFVVW